MNMAYFSSLMFPNPATHYHLKIFENTNATPSNGKDVEQQEVSFIAVIM